MYRSYRHMYWLLLLYVLVLFVQLFVPVAILTWGQILVFLTYSLYFLKIMQEHRQVLGMFLGALAAGGVSGIFANYSLQLQIFGFVLPLMFQWLGGLLCFALMVILQIQIVEYSLPEKQELLEIGLVLLPLLLGISLFAVNASDTSSTRSIGEFVLHFALSVPLYVITERLATYQEQNTPPQHLDQDDLLYRQHQDGEKA